MSNYQTTHLAFEDRETNKMAIASIVAGLLGLSLCGGVGSLIAIYTGFMARREMDDQPGRFRGGTLANIGLLLGWGGIAIIGLALAYATIMAYNSGGAFLG